MRASWNEIAIDIIIPIIKLRLSEARRRTLKARASSHIKVCPDCSSFTEFWTHVLEELRHINEFARGLEQGKTWKLSIEYVLQVQGCEKLLGGGWRAESGSTSGSPADSSDDDSAREEFGL